ncbi:MAG: PRC-barrel domain-containing protein, partial [Firmicutes bacterium]|nr:PRC-barrel domain-containing protein [Bacillota bacterium]
EGRSLGRVQGLVVNRKTKRVAALEVGERALLKTNTELIPFVQLRSIGNDAVTIMSAEAVQPADEQPELASLAESQLLGTRVVTVDGTFAGTVEDFSFNPEDGALAELFMMIEKPRAHLAFPVTVVENFGRDFVIVNKDYKIQVREAEHAVPDHTAQQLVRSLESKAVDFAIGRSVRQDVFDEDGGPIIRKGETVTTEIVESARAKNRLTQLLFAAGVGELLDGVDFTREKLDSGSKILMDTWQSLRGRSQEWLSRKLDDDISGATTELRELWVQVQSKVTQGGRELEDATTEKIHAYVLGKTLAHPVYDQEGTLLGGRGDVVTQEMRNKVEVAGRLPQLFLSATAGDVQGALEPIKKQIRNILGEK